MSLLDLLYLEDTQSAAAIAAVHCWCAEYDCDISGEEGRQAVAAAARLAKSTGSPDLFSALSLEMASVSRPSRADLVLVLEDEPFIALDMEEVLQAAGFESKIMSSCEAAMKWLAFRTPLAAILDFRLKDEVCTSAATLLQARGVPIIFCSGADLGDVPAHLHQAPWVQKPFDERQLTGLLRQVLQVRQLEEEA